MPALEAEEKAARQGARRRARASFPNLPLDDVPDRRRRARQCRAPPLRGEAQLRVHAEAAFRAGRSARPDGFRGRRETLRRALRGAEEGAGADGARARPVHARPCTPSEHGYTEVQPPLLVRDEVMFGTAQLPKFGDDQFIDDATNLVRSSSSIADRRKQHCATESTKPAISRRQRSIVPHPWLVSDLDAELTFKQPLAHPHRRSPAHQSRPRIHPRRGGAAAALHRADAVLPRRGRRGRAATRAA